ncbi:hypothetical protein LZ30DRAFT_227672 [Colletotrichum cereale]|nr:hypothetical protein LZ30DRAFT_227672 [Colletotrichum cereale]
MCGRGEMRMRCKVDKGGSVLLPLRICSCRGRVLGAFTGMPAQGGYPIVSVFGYLVERMERLLEVGSACIGTWPAGNGNSISVYGAGKSGSATEADATAGGQREAEMTCCINPHPSSREGRVQLAGVSDQRNVTGWGSDRRSCQGAWKLAVGSSTWQDVEKVPECGGRKGAGVEGDWVSPQGGTGGSGAHSLCSASAVLHTIQYFFCRSGYVSNSVAGVFAVARGTTMANKRGSNVRVKGSGWRREHKRRRPFLMELIGPSKPHSSPSCL